MRAPIVLYSWFDRVLLARRSCARRAPSVPPDVLRACPRTCSERTPDVLRAYAACGPAAFQPCPERVPIARYLISAPRACSYSCRLPKQMFFPRGAMDNYCLYCCRQPIVRPYRLHCSARCRDADRRSRHSSEVKDARYKILTVGHDRADEALFAAAERAMKSADDRALHSLSL